MTENQPQDQENQERKEAGTTAPPRKEAQKGRWGKGRGKGPGSLSRSELLLASAAGFVGFCGIIFCVVMIVLMTGIRY